LITNEFLLELQTIKIHHTNPKEEILKREKTSDEN